MVLMSVATIVASRDPVKIRLEERVRLKNRVYDEEEKEGDPDSDVRKLRLDLNVHIPPYTRH
jgi:hypothetical protein